MKLDILAFGIHPDDVELSCSGTLAKHKAMGYKVGICDLTCGEMGSRGSGEIRLQEAEKARQILNIDVRENLRMQDVWAEKNQENILKIITVVRKYKPNIVFCNAIDDRHPDHAKGDKMVKEAVFLSGLTRIETTFDNQVQEAFRPNVVYNYIQAKYLEVDFVVDVSDFYQQKIESILAYSSQFHNPNEVRAELEQANTFISDQGFLDMVRAKDIIWGKSIGVKYAEGFQTNRFLGIDDVTKLI